jgi:Homeodomain-like domain
MRRSRKGDGRDDRDEPVHRGGDPVRVQQAEAGLGVPELCRKYGVALATFYRWRQKYGALTKSGWSGLTSASARTVA